MNYDSSHDSASMESASNSDTLRRKHECSECGKHFARAYNLERHMITMHHDNSEDETEVSDDESNTSSVSDNESSAASDNESDTSDDSEVQPLKKRRRLSNDEDKAIDAFNELYNDLINTVYCSYHDKIAALTNENVAEGTEVVEATKEATYDLLPKMQKYFKQRIINILMIAKGMENLEKFERLFQKLEKYEDNDKSFADAIEMAVDREKLVLYKDVQAFIDELEFGLEEDGDI